jgi:amidohydrolase
MENPKVDVAFGLHIDSQTEIGKLTYKPGGALASVNDLRIVVKGRQAHGASPWSSVDPIVVSAQIINSLQTVVSRNINVTENAAVVTIGSIHGGVRSNIIPEEVEMKGTLRALTKDDEKLIIERVKKIVTSTAEGMGATVEINIPYESHYPVTYNDPELTAKMLPTLQKTAGASKVVLVPAETGAEDFSFFQEKVPGLFIFLGGMPKGLDPKKVASHHTPDFMIDDSGLSLGVKALSNLTLDYMNMSSVKK